MTMKEYNQQFDNITALAVFNAACDELDNTSISKFHRLRYSQAWVYETEHYFVLRSYDIYVAAICKSNGMCVDVLRKVFGYTPTSGKHICKFFADYVAMLPGYIRPEYKTYR